MPLIPPAPSLANPPAPSLLEGPHRLWGMKVLRLRPDRSADGRASRSRVPLPATASSHSQRYCTIQQDALLTEKWAAVSERLSLPTSFVGSVFTGVGEGAAVLVWSSVCLSLLTGSNPKTVFRLLSLSWPSFETFCSTKILWISGKVTIQSPLFTVYSTSG